MSTLILKRLQLLSIFSLFHPVEHIVSRSEPEDLMLVYNLPAFSRGDTPTFLAGVARSSGFLKKVRSNSPAHRSLYTCNINIVTFLVARVVQGGVLDLTAAARIVLRDWSTGKLERASIPPPTKSTLADLTTAFSELYTTADSDVLSRVRTKKEMRKEGGLVKMASGTVDGRELELEKVWIGLEADSEDEEDEEEDDPMAVDEDELDEEMEAPSGEEDSMSDDVDEDEEEEANEEPTPPPSPKLSKRKRPSAPSKSSPPSKKVAFSNKPLPPSSSVSASATPKSRAEKRAGRSSAAAPSEPPKSALKSSKAPANGSSKTAGGKRTVANAPSKKAAGGAVAANAAGAGDAYDFGKFF